MRHRLVPISIGVLCAVMIFNGIALSLVNGRPPSAEALIAAVTCAVGLVLIAKVPTNKISWLMMTAGVVAAVLFQGNSLTISEWRSLVPDEVVTAFMWTGNWLWFVGVVSIISTVFIFPTGHIPSRRWRFLMWIGWTASVLMIAAMALGPLEAEGLTNPFEIADADLLLIPGSFLTLIYAGGAVVSLFIRYRSAPIDQRAQIRWVAYASVVALVLWLLGGQLSDVLPGQWDIVNVLVFSAIPVAIAVAVLRYRLYDIDKLVNRTATYGLVVATLAIVFIAGAVWLPQQLPVGNSALAVAATTLAVAALFNPLRRRVQAVVDRRFNRLPYDPDQVRDNLAHQLRSTVDADELSAMWISVSAAPLQPRTAGVWVRSQE
ncbi:MAG: hypothetical protein ACR2N9_09210 [Acidimicrobiia bacterium]